jgi:hypothetical protein
MSPATISSLRRRISSAGRPLPRLLRDHLGEAAADPVAFKLKEVQVYPLLGSPDLLEPLVEGLWTIAEQGEPVVRASGEEPLSEGAND